MSDENIDKNGLLSAALDKMPSRFIPVVVLNMAFCVAMWFILTSDGFSEYSELKIGLILLGFCTVFITSLFVVQRMGCTPHTSAPRIVYDQGKTKIVCPFWTAYTNQEEPQIELSDDGVASVDGYRAYRFLIHIFKHQRCESFYALDLAFSRWYEVVEKDSVFNVSDTLLTSIGEMCRQKNCREFRRILCITEKELFDTKHSSIDVLNKIQEEEKN